MLQEPFANGNSFIHNLDPRIRILFAFFFAIIVATTWHLSALLWAFFFVVVVFVLTKLNMRDILKRILVVNTFIVLLVIILPFSYPGQVIYALGPLTLTKQGFFYALYIFLKSNLILTCVILLLSTTSIFSLAHALHHLHVPSKLVQLIFFTFRYIHVIYRQYQKLMRAAKLRCFTPKTNIYTYKTYAYLVASLLIKSYDRSERVYKAMVCRGFQGTFPVFRHFKMTTKDRLFSMAATIYLFLLAILAWK
ncbi:MAG: cobalt ECF transporter T component CbiQ [Candidatus Desulfofervidaceae bacterium]|nr:cobalt ECF transporter T component CbiQ [Candidatus Desulfofervidaceae bacterium]